MWGGGSTLSRHLNQLYNNKKDVFNSELNIKSLLDLIKSTSKSIETNKKPIFLAVLQLCLFARLCLVLFFPHHLCLRPGCFRNSIAV